MAIKLSRRCDKDIIFMILQFLNEGKYEKTAHKFEEETSVFFNINYFEDEVMKGNWDEVERYLLGFTKIGSNRHSMELFFKIRKHKYLEAIDKNDDKNALDILTTDLIIFKIYDEEQYKELTQLLTIKKFRQHEHLSTYGDANNGRGVLLMDLKRLIERNPLLKEKLIFPSLENSSLRWQLSNLLYPSARQSDAEGIAPCFAVSSNDCYVISSSGGTISLFNMKTFKRIKTFLPPSPAATCLSFYPEDENIFVIGMEDSTINLYHACEDKIIRNLDGHKYLSAYIKPVRITGLAFSKVLKVLVSADAYAQLCVWKWKTWKKQKSTFLHILSSTRPVSQTRVHFLQDQVHFLLVHQSQLATYKTTSLQRVNQWLPCGSSGQITDAALSCDRQLVYASFKDATVCVFSSAKLQPQCRINPSAYLPAYVSSSTVHPLVIAAHPSEPNQFALGLIDGNVHVIEPLASDRKWGADPPYAENTLSPRRGSTNSD